MNNTAVLGQFSEWEVFFTITMIGVISIIAVFGNILVFIAFYQEKRLRGPTNNLILSLAIADFFIGAFPAIIYALYIYCYDWIYGIKFCILWLTLGYWIFQASVIWCYHNNYRTLPYHQISFNQLYRQQENVSNQIINHTNMDNIIFNMGTNDPNAL